MADIDAIEALLRSMEDGIEENQPKAAPPEEEIPFDLTAPLSPRQLGLSPRGPPPEPPGIIQQNTPPQTPAVPVLSPRGPSNDILKKKAPEARNTPPGSFIGGSPSAATWKGPSRSKLGGSGSGSGSGTSAAPNTSPQGTRPANGNPVSDMARARVREMESILRQAHSRSEELQLRVLELEELQLVSAKTITDLSDRLRTNTDSDALKAQLTASTRATEALKAQLDAATRRAEQAEKRAEAAEKEKGSGGGGGGGGGGSAIQMKPQLDAALKRATDAESKLVPLVERLKKTDEENQALQAKLAKLVEMVKVERTRSAASVAAAPSASVASEAAKQVRVYEEQLRTAEAKMKSLVEELKTERESRRAADEDLAELRAELKLTREARKEAEMQLGTVKADYENARSRLVSNNASNTAAEHEKLLSRARTAEQKETEAVERARAAEEKLKQIEEKTAKFVDLVRSERAKSAASLTQAQQKDVEIATLGAKVVQLETAVKHLEGKLKTAEDARNRAESSPAGLPPPPSGLPPPPSAPAPASPDVAVLQKRNGDLESKIRMLVETIKNEREQHRREIEKLIFGGGGGDGDASPRKTSSPAAVAGSTIARPPPPPPLPPGTRSSQRPPPPPMPVGGGPPPPPPPPMLKSKNPAESLAQTIAAVKLKKGEAVDPAAIGAQTMKRMQKQGINFGSLAEQAAAQRRKLRPVTTVKPGDLRDPAIDD